MKSYNFSKSFINYKSKAAMLKTDQYGNDTDEELKMDSLLGDLLMSSSSKTHFGKYVLWAIKLYEGKELELDSEDVKMLKKFIEDVDNISAIIRHQLIEVLEGDKTNVKPIPRARA